MVAASVEMERKPRSQHELRFVMLEKSCATRRDVAIYSTPNLPASAKLVALLAFNSEQKPNLRDRQSTWRSQKPVAKKPSPSSAAAAKVTTTTESEELGNGARSVRRKAVRERPLRREAAPGGAEDPQEGRLQRPAVGRGVGRRRGDRRGVQRRRRPAGVRHAGGRADRQGGRQGGPDRPAGQRRGRHRRRGPTGSTR